MTAPKRVAQAAETIRARWERQVSTDPQTEAAQALEDTGQLLDPEVAAELVAFRKARELDEAVAEYGAFPVPVGPQSQELSPEREREIRSLDLLALMDDRVAPVISGHLAALLAEIDQLRAQRERRRLRLIALQNDALNMRGALSPMGEARKVPLPLGPTLLPAVEWLIGRVAELESDLATANGVLEDVAKARRAATTQALPWAHTMPDGDLHGFLDDMVSAAMGRWRSGPEVPDRTVLADIERVCREWRTPGEGYRSDPESDEPAPIQAGGFFDGVPVSPPSERPVDGCRLTAEQMQELGNPFLGGGA